MQNAVMSLQFTHVRSFACRDRLGNLREDCSTAGLYCVTMTLQAGSDPVSKFRGEISVIFGSQVS